MNATAGSTSAAAVAPSPLVDVHTHFMPPDLPDLTARTGDPRWPRLVPRTDGQKGEIRQGHEIFRVVGTACWDLDSRLDALDRINVDVQVLSPVPVALTYWAESTAATEYCRAYNDALAATSERSGGRLLAFGTVPLQEPAAAVAELRRIAALGMAGVEIGTMVAGRELDDPSLRLFFAEAAAAGMVLFVHPVDSGGATRCCEKADIFGIGMPTDTAIAASAFVFGGVLAEIPDLQVCLAHGGGSFAWLYPRLRFGAVDARLRNEMPKDPDDLVRRLWVDTLLFDADQLTVLARRFGPDRLLFGSDFPFVPFDTATVGVDTASLVGNAERFLRLPVSAVGS